MSHVPLSPRRPAAVVLAFAALLTASAPAQQAPAASKTSAAPSQVEKFVMGQDTDIQRLDATTTIRTQDRTVYGHVLDPLLLRAANGTVQGKLASKWEWASEGRVLRELFSRGCVRDWRLLGCIWYRGR